MWRQLSSGSRNAARSLATKSVVVTGGSRGIGAAISRRLADEGWAVAVNYRSNSAAAEQVVRDISSTGGTAVAMQGDLSSEAGVGAFFASFDLAGLPPLTSLVNNAGVLVPLPSPSVLLLLSTAAVWCTVVILPPRWCAPIVFPTLSLVPYCRNRGPSCSFQALNWSMWQTRLSSTSR